MRRKAKEVQDIELTISYVERRSILTGAAIELGSDPSNSGSAVHGTSFK